MTTMQSLTSDHVLNPLLVYDHRACRRQAGPRSGAAAWAGSPLAQAGWRGPNQNHVLMS